MERVYEKYAWVIFLALGLLWVVYGLSELFIPDTLSDAQHVTGMSLSELEASSPAATKLVRFLQRARDPDYDLVAAGAPPSHQEVLPKKATIWECVNEMVKFKIFLSLVFAIVGYLLGIVADATHYTELPIYPAACFLKILLFLVAVPLAHSAGKSIRKELNINGIPGLRFVSWVMYGVALVHFMLFFQWDLISAQPGNIQLPDGQITIDAAIFFISSMLMIADAWNSYKSKD